MYVELSDEARRYIGRFDELTGVAPKDCLVEGDRLVFLVPAGKMAAAIGQAGETVEGRNGGSPSPSNWSRTRTRRRRSSRVRSRPRRSTP